MPIITGKADMEIMVKGICNSPMAPKVQNIPRNTMAMGRRDHLTWLKVMSKARIISSPARAMMGPLLLAISSVMDCISAGSPVTVTRTSGGNSAILTWPDVSA